MAYLFQESSACSDCLDDRKELLISDSVLDRLRERFLALEQPPGAAVVFPTTFIPNEPLCHHRPRCPKSANTTGPLEGRSTCPFSYEYTNRHDRYPATVRNAVCCRGSCVPADKHGRRCKRYVQNFKVLQRVAMGDYSDAFEVREEPVTVACLCVSKYS